MGSRLLGQPLPCRRPPARYAGSPGRTTDGRPPDTWLGHRTPSKPPAGPSSTSRAPTNRRQQHPWPPSSTDDLPSRPPQAGHTSYASPCPPTPKQILTDSAWPALATALADAETAGHDPASLLQQATDQRALADARSPAQVLGPSPRARGADGASNGGAPVPGSIPAGAGSRGHHDSRGSPMWVHPAGAGSSRSAGGRRPTAGVHPRGRGSRPADLGFS